MVIGTVNATNGTPLPFANVYISNQAGAVTGESGDVATAEGEFHINANPGQYLTASFVGYEKSTRLLSEDDALINFFLEANATLPEVTIYGNRIKPINWMFIVFMIMAALIIYLLYYLQ